LVECSNVLLHIIQHNKKASINTIIKKCTLGVQVIKKTLALAKRSLSKPGKWKLIKVGSSRTSAPWEQSNHQDPPFETLAAIYSELLEKRKLDSITISDICRFKGVTIGVSYWPPSQCKCLSIAFFCYFIFF
jgi:hypothetical protein